MGVCLCLENQKNVRNNNNYNNNIKKQIGKKNITEINISSYLNTIYSNEEDTPKENDHNNNYIIYNNINNNIMNLNNNNNFCDKNNNKNINVIIKYNSYQKNMGIKNKRLQTILETVKEVSNSIVDSSELNANSLIDNNNINNNVDSNNEDIEKKNNENLNNIFINEQKFQNSENRINDSENNTGSALATAAVNNTKKSLYFSKSEKPDQ